MARIAAAALLAAGCLLGGGAGVQGQVTLADYNNLKINEIIASNDATLPQNCRCRHQDMIEIYNASSNLVLPLDSSTLKATVQITDNSVDAFTQQTRYLSFKGHSVRNINPNERIVIFADGSAEGTVDCDNRDNACELLREQIDIGEIHAPFALDNDGELVTLELLVKGDVGQPDQKIKLDEVHFPPLGGDISYGRFPDGTNNWVFSRSPSFGSCAKPTGTGRPSCIGEPNRAGDLIDPNIDLFDYTSNNPAAGAPFVLRAKITDEKGPDAPNIAIVQIHYWVDRSKGGAEQMVAMEYKATGNDELNTVDTWSIWEGSIPGQAAGSVVEYYFYVKDADGREETDPRTDPAGTPGGTTLCAADVGPCHREDVAPDLGPGCAVGQDCRIPYRYTVASAYAGPLVLNEVAPNNDSLLEDPSEKLLVCEPTNPRCRFDDFIEIYNNSDEIIHLDGLWLSNDAFNPTGWQFPFGSGINPRQYLIVWIDNDGKDPEQIDDPPNPNDPANQQFHTNFGIDATHDEVYIFDTAANHYQIIDAIRWGQPRATQGLPALARDPKVGVVEIPVLGVPIDESLARCPSNDRNSPWVYHSNKADATPKVANTCGATGQPLFKRGDFNADGGADISDGINILELLFLGKEGFPCMDAGDVDDSGEVDISDPISLLTFLFLGGASTPPAPPGVDACGPDPTADDPLADCVYDPISCR